MKGAADYYDEFSERYERGRFHGYHAFIDDLEARTVIPHARNKLSLEAGCGTGLIMKRLKTAGAVVFGADLSIGMLGVARKRGFPVVRADIRALPFKDESFDTVYSFKVLAHVRDAAGAVEEMARVTRRGGCILPEFYNRCSLRFLVRTLKGARRISDTTTDREVYTRYDTWKDILNYVPASCRLEGVKGLRIWTLFPFLLRIPLLANLLAAVERICSNSCLKRFGGFVILELRRVA
jgi:SAM-dependent methyltransferase